MRLVNFENYFALSELGVFICCFYSKGYSSYNVSGGGLFVVLKIAVSVSCTLRLNEGNRSRNRDIPTRTSKTPDLQTTSAPSLHVILSGWGKTHRRRHRLSNNLLKIDLSFGVRRRFSSTTVAIVAAEFARLVTTGASTTLCDAIHNKIEQQDGIA